MEGGVVSVLYSYTGHKLLKCGVSLVPWAHLQTGRGLWGGGAVWPDVLGRGWEASEARGLGKGVGEQCVSNREGGS